MADLNLDKEALQSVPKERLGLIVLKAAIEQVQQEYAFSERRACRLMTMVVDDVSLPVAALGCRCGRNWWGH